MQNGDLLFVRSKNSKFEQMIADSTSQKHDYTHVGILIDKQVINATTKHGCIKQSLDEFVSEQKAPIDIFRIMNKRIDFDLIQQHAKSMLGLPYNHSFIQADKGLYCSELITEIFKDYHIFKLKPLNFGTGEQVKYWKQYYQKLRLTLPTNELGSSPNSLVDSDKLKFVDKIKRSPY
ncbi:YiiX/YebB-like N1pC/P60 family cysteine hydrolase [Apilactobacillus timberlakei]|uniref:YiiX/YebB-like N1pC/P60 family cysteine hydrolase n=1 Tax=Apilactobacillus timberlakei TaxID=2008380 RepID=UPI0015E834BD|nr:YiiX/YebB-like N1pC/P60 family cysteine hydrolase [Apilactobacillus timberlakei]